jgi:Fur family peroxide stress response transcriptional regulator
MEMDAGARESRLEDLRKRCREAGMNVTPQRSAVYEALLDAPNHPTPEALYAAVRARMPGISLATIYKALEALKRLGVVREVARLGEARRFDANIDRHHHLICTECGRVSDIDHGEFGNLPPPRSLDGFIPSEVSVQVFGRCAACARDESPEDEI